jgi:hypothetical protein
LAPQIPDFIGNRIKPTYFSVSRFKWIPADGHHVVRYETFQIGPKIAAPNTHRALRPWTRNQIVYLGGHQNSPLIGIALNMRAQTEQASLRYSIVNLSPD